MAGHLVAGLLSFVSPCVLPLVPPYLCYMAGVSLDQLTGQSDVTVARRTVFLSALAFVLGFSTIFVAPRRDRLRHRPTGAASHLDVLLGRHRRRRHHHRHGPAFPRRVQDRASSTARRGWRCATIRPGRSAPISSGLAFAFGWTPCIGPVLAAILVVAGAEQTVARGAVLLAVYSLGLGMPFLAGEPLRRAVHALHAALPAAISARSRRPWAHFWC